MTYQEVLDDIQAVIIANANNEITADLLRPVVEAVLDFANDHMGDLTALNTTDKDTLVDAINEVFNALGSETTILTGTTDPNVTPPGAYNLGDFYEWNDGGLKGFYQYNGTRWVRIKVSEKQEFTATALQTVFNLSDAVPPYNVDVWIDRVCQIEDTDYTYSAGTITMAEGVELDSIVVVRKYY